MTMALCFRCGSIKRGALCPCPACKEEPTGKPALDIAFTDHYLAVETLREFGAVMKEIEAHANDPTERFWAFVEYVSTQHPSVLTVDIAPESKVRLVEILKQCRLPSVTLRESPMEANRQGKAAIKKSVAKPAKKRAATSR